MTTRHSLGSVAALLLVCLVHPLGAQLVFEPARSLESGMLAADPAIGDVDEDGVLDIVVVDFLPFLDPLLTVFHGNGDGTFTGNTLDTGTTLTFVLLAEVTGDDHLDLVAITSDGDLGVLPGAGDGTFGALIPSSGGIGLVGITVADLTGNGRLDVVGTELPFPPEPVLKVFHAMGGGSFVAVQAIDLAFEIGGLSARIGIGDVDEDGWLDVAVDDVTDEVHVYRNAGDGLLDPLPVVVPIGGRVTDLLLADLDHDGHLDLACSVSDETLGGMISIASGGGDGTFGPLTSWPTGTGAGGVAAADLDRDTYVDLVAADTGELSGTQDLVILRQLPDGSYEWDVAVTVWDESALSRPSVADLDNDGRPDLVVTALSDSAPFVALNHTYGRLQPFEDLGSALPGGRGWPILLAQGQLAADTRLRLQLSAATPGAPVFAVLGAAQLDAPLLGGTLVPSPDLVLPVGMATPDGDLLLQARVPVGLAGSSFFVQLWIEDAEGPAGFAATTGVRADVP